MSKVVTRPFRPATDSGFIFSSFPKGVYHCSIHEIPHHREEFFRIFYEYTKEQIANADIIVACMSDDSDTILGYSIINKGILQWVYVKELFRKHGLATLLVKNRAIHDINEDNITKAGLAILRKHPNLFKKKEEENERDTSQAH